MEEPNEEVIQEWKRQRDLLKEKLVLQDTQEWQLRDDDLSGLGLVGGVDLSFVKDSDVACAAYVVCKYSTLEVVYEQMEIVHLTAPYIPGFLAFREADPLLRLIEAQRSTHPQFNPDAIIIDGNGILHNYEFGLACHLGVLADTPTVGAAKNLYQMNDEGILRDKEHHRQIARLQRSGDKFDLVARGKVLGVALKTCKEASKPVFVSVGHRMSLETAVKLVLKCSKHRVPEPTRQADIRSREYIRKHCTPPTNQETS